MKLIMQATKAVNALPSGASRDLYSAHASFSKVMAKQSENVLSVIQKVLVLQGIKGNIVRRDKEEKFEILQECNDSMLERINSNLDEIAGIRKQTPSVLVTEVKSSPIPQNYQLSTTLNANKPMSSPSAKLITAKNIIRPQINFSVPVDNSPNPFSPRLKDKPNSLKPLAILPEYDEDKNIVSYLHPYEFEIEKFEPSGELLKEKEPKIPTDITGVAYIYVDNESKLAEMMNELRTVQEIAVDLEHHSYRTFMGITCLMQISTRANDYIIDTIALREELHILNEVFTNPKVIKVFHGADSDVEWLQRDLSLYLVNLFDTHQASRRLGFARLSLAFLLKHYCNIDADKTFQLADWRMRPLPEQLMKYAQQDTHYLLYIYDMMTNDLIKAGNGQPNLVKTVFMDSKIVSLKRYVKPIVSADSHKDLYLKSKRSFDNRQLYALREIFVWRDKIARLEDESYPYVLPNHMLLQISETLPREMQGILACCNPIPPLVRQHLNLIHQIVLKAREQPLIKPMTNEANLVRQTVNLNDKKDLLNNPLYCPHDLSHQAELRDDLPTLIGNKEIKQMIADVEIAQVKLTVFDKSDSGIKKVNGAAMQFISPYNRYKLMIPFMEEQKKREQALEEEKRKQLLEEKRKQLPELQVVKISDDNLYKTPLKDLKRPFDQVEQQQPIPISNKRWRKEVAKQEAQKAPEEPPAVVDLTGNTPGRPQRDGRNNSNSKKKGKPQNQSDFRQASDKPVNFDYSQVDYNRFQSGASGAPKNQKDNGFQQKFKGGKKGKANLDKMFSFSNFKLNKRK